jgi:hypothetical protein
MNRERILEVVLTMLGAVLLLIAADGNHPYGFYIVLRLAITVGAVYWAWRVYKAGQQVWTWIFATIALLLNPFLPIRLQRTQWQPIDLYLGIFLIGWSGYWFFRKPLTRPESNFARDMEQGRKWLEEQKRTREWYRESAEQGDAYAQSKLGCLYTIGGSKDGPAPHDDTQAAFWWRKAAEQGYAPAQYNLGASYSRGHGVPQDYTQAAAWYRKAAEQGDAQAQYNLGFLYALGQGVPQDYAQAAFWYREAAERGDAQAQFQLGALYDDGLGVPQDYAEAYFWLDLVAAGKLDTSDSKQVAKYRDRVASHLTPADLSRQQERARKWFEAHRAKPQ